MLPAQLRTQSESLIDKVIAVDRLSPPLSDQELEAFSKCLACRRDSSPDEIHNAPPYSDRKRLSPTGFGLEKGSLALRVCTEAPKSALEQFFRSGNKYWLYVGRPQSGEFIPLSCHSSLVYAAEMLLLVYSSIMVI
jgi:hypothetical protein